MPSPLNLLKRCLASARQHALTAGISVVLCIIAGVVGGAAVGVLLGRAAPIIDTLAPLSPFVSLGPLSLVLLCLAPCLAPLFLLLKRDNRQTEAPEALETPEATQAPGSPDASS